MTPFDSPRPRRRSRSTRTLVRWNGVCPTCAGPLDRLVHEQGSLFHHGGYGGTEITTSLVCWPCRWSTVARVETGNPRNWR